MSSQRYKKFARKMNNYVFGNIKNRIILRYQPDKNPSETFPEFKNVMIEIPVDDTIFSSFTALQENTFRLRR